MRRVVVVLILATAFTATAFSQSLDGLWEGTMLSKESEYTFLLEINSANASSDRKTPSLTATAVHNRQGYREIIELEGTIYNDNSIWLVDVRDKSNTAGHFINFSRLQFEFQRERGGAVLNGHWQQYLTEKTYRLGRLVLKRKERKGA